MRVPGLVYASERLMEHAMREKAGQQVANVAHLPGVVRASMAMPDIHWGYGFPIGGVAAMDVRDGVISPGGVGYDINCGVRLLRSKLAENDVAPHIQDIVAALFSDVPSGVGSKGDIKVSASEERKILTQGSAWAVRHGFGTEEDLVYTEEGGAMEGADPDAVSERAYERGRRQQGTLGSGNHFLEVQVVDEVYDEAAAAAFGLEVGMVTVMIHSGSRGFGYQVCDDYLARMGEAARRYGISMPDRQLACAPVSSPEGKAYFGAMAAAANYAWANRQCLSHHARRAIERVLHASPADLGLSLVYDIAHNIAKFEEHEVEGRPQELCVHRKGATRAFGPGRPEVPPRYRDFGQPVIIPGDMGTASYVLAGTETAMAETWGSTCHGAGRVLSRGAAKKRAQGRSIDRELARDGIIVRGASRKGLAEEMPEAYKNIDEVVAVVHGAGISRKVARMRPLGVIKG